MGVVNFYSNKKGEINRFLSGFYETNLDIYSDLKWEKNYNNPIEMAEIIGVFIDNNDKYEISMWVSLDKGLYINVTDNNANDLIKYIYERFPF